jgi:hypothetical protein
MATTVADHLDSSRYPMRGEMRANRQPLWLTQAIHETVHRVRGVAKVIAAELGCHERSVTELADGTRRVPLKAYQIPAFIRATHDFTILDAIEARVGRVAFRLAQGSATPDDMHRRLSAAVRQFGDFLAVMGDAIEDGTLDAQEATDVVKEIDELIAVLCETRARVIEQAQSDAKKDQA